MDLAPLEILECGPGRMEQAVAEGKADLAITYVPVPMSGVEFIQVTKVKMGVFGLASWANEKFTGLPFVIPSLPLDGTPSKVIGLDGWPDHQFEKKVRYRVTLMESALELCREGRAVAYLPEFAVKLHNKSLRSEYQLKEFKCPVPTKDRAQSVFLIRRQGSTETHLERQIAKSLRSLG